jgi:twinkle protein
VLSLTNYLEDVRGFEPETLDRYGVREKSLRGVEVVTIEYRRNGEVYGHKVRPLVPGADGKRFWFQPSGVKRGLWNVDCLQDETLFDQPVIITEGELDALSCIGAGFPRSVSIPDGWSDKFMGDDGPKSRPVLANADRLKRSPFVIAAGDKDPTGGSFIKAVQNMLEGHPVKFLDYPDGCKDANDVLKKHGPAELARVINAAKWYSWSDPDGGQLTGFSDMPPMPDMQLFRPDYPPFDKVILFHSGFLTIITGIPSSGKTTFLNCALHHVIRSNCIRVGLALFETPGNLVRDHLSRLRLGIPWGDLDSAKRGKLVEGLDRDYRLLHRLDSDEAPHDLGWVREMMHTAAVRDGCKIVAFDPWNELEHMPQKGESMTNYVNIALTRMRQWAERFDCAVCILAHPMKMHAHAGAKPSPPLGYDISDSAAWYNKAAIGVTVHQAGDANDPHVKVINWKSKFVQQYGIAKGEIRLDFDERAMTYRAKGASGW